MQTNLTIEEHLRYTPNIPEPIRAWIEQHLDDAKQWESEAAQFEQDIEKLETRVAIAEQLLDDIRDDDECPKSIYTLIHNSEF